MPKFAWFGYKSVCMTLYVCVCVCVCVLCASVCLQKVLSHFSVVFNFFFKLFFFFFLILKQTFLSLSVFSKKFFFFTFVNFVQKKILTILFLAFTKEIACMDKSIGLLKNNCCIPLQIIALLQFFLYSINFNVANCVWEGQLHK